MLSTVFLKKHKTQFLLLVGVFVVSSIIFFFPDVVAAAATTTTKDEGSSSVGSYLANTALWPFKAILYAVFSALGFFLSAAISLFAWAIDPEYMQLINRPAVYQMWQFIRDFFNLFFILTLLYIAFTTIFQVSKDYKKALLNLVIMALLVNFSFPISRFLIDAGNVPMYYFANQITSLTTPGAQLGSFLGASQLQNILITGDKDDSYQDKSIQSMDFTRLVIAVVYVFIFMVSIMVMSVMFVIRLVALIILVIFSSVGFAGTVIPGMSKFANQWWGSFTQYVLYGPAAMLMLLVATRFVDATNDDFRRMEMTATGISVPGTTGMIASMAMFAVPIVMLWFAIGLSSKMSIAGSAAVVGTGLGAITWAGKKFSGYNKLKSNYESYRSTRKKREDEKNKNNLGSILGGGLNRKQDQALAVLGSKAAAERVKDVHNKEIYEKAEENKKNGVSDSQLRLDLTSGDKVKAAAAAMSLSERGAISSADDFAAALKSLGGNTKEISALIEKASGGAMGNLKSEDYTEIMNSKLFEDNPNLRKKLESRVKKEGGAKVVVDYTVSKMEGGATAANQKAAVEKVIQSMKSADDVAASESLFTDSTYGTHATAYVNDPTKTTAERQQAIKKSSAENGTSVGSMVGTTQNTQKAKLELRPGERVSSGGGIILPNDVRSV